MSIDLKNKLKEAKRNSELKTLIKTIILETNLQGKDINCCHITYQEVVNKSHDKLKLRKNHFDIESEKVLFEIFLAKISGQDFVTLMIKTDSNIFFLSLPYNSIKNNLDFFWYQNKLTNHTDEKIFINKDLSKGFVIFASEYGIETASW